MNEMSVRIILKSGSEFTVKCQKFNLKENALNEVLRYEIEGISENKPIWIDWTQVAAVVRVYSDEIGDGSVD